MLWATRQGCHVDRTACIWLIQRFIDPEAAFSFFGDPAEAPEGGGTLRRGRGQALPPRGGLLL
jgi:hypothetical protein